MKEQSDRWLRTIVVRIILAANANQEMPLDACLPTFASPLVRRQIDADQLFIVPNKRRLVCIGRV